MVQWNIYVSFGIKMKFTQKVYVSVSFLREVATDSCETRVHLAHDGCYARAQIRFYIIY
jgi:hypothetical protein